MGVRVRTAVAAGVGVQHVPDDEAAITGGLRGLLLEPGGRLFVPAASLRDRHLPATSRPSASRPRPARIGNGR